MKIIKSYITKKKFELSDEDDALIKNNPTRYFFFFIQKGRLIRF